ncbi:hypothetical protein M5K25_015796 [Dendrobium thyrsiflorum]|uniref:RNase H type-1 domain-containing protein n=1 Tax=Dendrobium thyrsiflorum TaxID=117978 RepID=A0ABD0US09_DENTH
MVDKCGPLRAKIAWNFINKPHSLLSRSLLAKYGNQIWDGVYRCNASTTWRLLRDGARHLRPLLRWRISSGNAIDTINDKWFLDLNICRWPTYVAELDDATKFVSGFIKDRSWDVVKLKQFFGIDLVDAICSVPIHLEEDKMDLIYKCSGKSISALVWEKSFEDLEDVQIWSRFKKLKLRPRVELFWWRLGLNAIPSNHFLMHRKLSDISSCPRGCISVEDKDHVAVKCIKISTLLDCLSKWGCYLPMFTNFDDCIDSLLKLAVSNPFVGNLYCSVVFLCWKGRNKVFHGGSDDSPLYIAANAFSYAVATFPCNLILENWDANQLCKLSQYSWRPPPPGWVKANVDVTLATSNKACIGGVFRDSKGRFLYAFGRGFLHWDGAQAEVLSVLAVGDFIQEWMLEAEGLIVECDNYNVIKVFKGFLNKEIDKEGVLNSKDLDFLDHFKQFCFSFSFRECNRLVDFCANLALNSDFIWDDIGSNNVPPSFVSLLKEECSCN